MKKILTVMALGLTCHSIQAEINSSREGYVSDDTSPHQQSGSPFGNEGFDDINTLSWTMDNQSSPVGTSGWFQGNDLVFSAQSGKSTSYIAANFNNTAGSDICNWLIMPDLGYLQTLSFWSRTTTAANFPDRLQVLHSPTGATNTGDCSNGFGDFTEILIEINPNLASNTYPETWTQFNTNIDATGRVAFVYFIEDINNNGNYIGIDNVEWLSGLPVSDISMSTNHNIAGSLEIGDTVTVSHTMTNNGPQDATAANAVISLSADLTYVSNTCSAVLNGQNLTWQVGNLANGSSASCNITVEVSNYGQHLYRAASGAAEIDSNPNNNNSQFYINGPIAIISAGNLWTWLILMGLIIGYPLLLTLRHNTVIQDFKKFLYQGLA